MATRWSVPPMWVGGTVAVLAGGYSLSSCLPLIERCRGRVRTIAVNSTFRKAPWADMLYASDLRWWQNTPDAMEFAGVKVTAAFHDGNCMDDPRLMRLTFTGKDGIDPDPRCVRTGGNSASPALQIAVKAGAARVLLCGVDCRYGPDGESHHHGDHPAPLTARPSPATMATWAQRFRTLARQLKGVEVINCNPDSAVDAFPRMTIEDALDACGLRRPEGIAALPA